MNEFVQIVVGGVVGLVLGMISLGTLPALEVVFRYLRKEPR